MANNICLIIDAEPAYIRSKVEEIYKEWGFPRENVKELTEWQGSIKGTSLFGDKLIQYLNLQDKNNLKSFVSLLTGKQTKEVFKDPEWYGNGIIFAVSSIQGAAKIKKLVEDYDGSIYLKEDPKERKNKLLNSINLNKESRDLVDYFVGEDYTLLLSFVNEMKQLTADQQASIPADKVLTYFPPTPGKTPPWDFMNDLLNGDTVKAIQEFERTVQNTNVLVPMLFLQRQISLLLRIATARIDIPNNPKKLAAAIGEKAYGGFYPVYYVATRTSLLNVQQVALEVVKLENDLKGRSKVDPISAFKASLAKIGLLLNH